MPRHPWCTSRPGAIPWRPRRTVPAAAGSPREPGVAARGADGGGSTVARGGSRRSGGVAQADLLHQRRAIEAALGRARALVAILPQKERERTEPSLARRRGLFHGGRDTPAEKLSLR